MGGITSRASRRAICFAKGHPVTVYKDAETGSVTGFKYDVDDRVQIYESTLGAGIIKAYRQPIRYTVRPVSLAFEVKNNNFHATALKQHLPESIVECLEDAFSSRYDLDHMAAGTAVKLIYDEHVSRDGVHRVPGDIEAAEIRHGTHAIKAFAFRDEHGRAHLYDEEGHALGPQFLRFPVNFQYISSGFTLASISPDPSSISPASRGRFGRSLWHSGQGHRRRQGRNIGMVRRTRQLHPPRSRQRTVSIYGHLSKIDPNATTRQLHPHRRGHRAGRLDRAIDRPTSSFRDREARPECRPAHSDPGRASSDFAAHAGGVRESQNALPDARSRSCPISAAISPPAISRKPAISPFADQYHVTLTPHLASRPRTYVIARIGWFLTQALPTARHPPTDTLGPRR